MAALRRPRLWGAAALLLTGGLGAVMLLALGAPSRLPAMNLGAALAGAILLPLLVPAVRLAGRHPAATLASLAAALLATAIWGADLEGVRRWARVGPLLFHVGFLVLPLALAVLPRVSWAPGALGVIAACLVIQPDGGSALALAVGVAAYAALRPSRTWAALLIVAGVSAAVAWFRPDPLPAVAYVEQVVPLALDRGPALAAGAILALVLPAALLAWAAWRGRSVVAAPLAGFWIGAAAASVLGNFPTPILGGGVTPILAYALSWAIIAASTDAAAGTRTSRPGSQESAASRP